MTTTESTGETIAPSGCPVSDLASSFDPFRDPYLGDPYPFLHRARLEEPVFYSPELDYWVVTSYEDIFRIFRDTETFSASVVLEPLTPLCPKAIEKAIGIGFTPGLALVNEDPPVHTARRRLLLEPFTPNRVNLLEPRVRSWVTEYIDAFVRKGEADLVTDLVYEIPALTALIFMGVPEEDVPIVKQFAAHRAIFNWGRPTEEEQVGLVEDMGEYWNYCKGHVHRLMEKPGNDYVSEVIERYRERPDLFDENYLYTICFNFLYAGHETTTNAAAAGFRLLLEHREQWEELCSDPSLTGNAIEEILRHQSSVPAWRRRTTKATEVGGVAIPEGGKILIVTGSANHDDQIFDDGERFDIRRENADKHFAFGNGRHLCMGAPLARMEMRVFLEEVTRRLPHVELVSDQKWEYSPNTSFRGPKHVMVRWDPSQNPVAADRP